MLNQGTTPTHPLHFIRKEQNLGSPTKQQVLTAKVTDGEMGVANSKCAKGRVVDDSRAPIPKKESPSKRENIVYKQDLSVNKEQHDMSAVAQAAYQAENILVQKSEVNKYLGVDDTSGVLVVGVQLQSKLPTEEHRPIMNTVYSPEVVEDLPSRELDPPDAYVINKLPPELARGKVKDGGTITMCDGEWTVVHPKRGKAGK